MLRKLCCLSLVAGCFSIPFAAIASDSESGQEIYRSKKSIVVDCSCGKAWSVVSDFSSIAKWYSGFSRSRRVGGNEGQVGEVRELVRSSNGQMIHEKLIYINSDEKELAYTHTMNGPVKESIAIVSMTDLAGGQCMVSWSNTMKLNNGQDPLSTLNKFNSAYKKVLEDLRDYLTSPK
jgi:hypothetical protein